MQDKDRTYPIAFAVYRREVGFDQQLNSDFAYGNVINRLSVQWQWINIQAKFLKSNDIVKLTADKVGLFPNQELIFIDWLRRTAEKFLDSSAEHLVVLNSSLYLPDSFEELVLRTVQSIREPEVAISLWPVSTLTDQPIEASFEIFPATEISKLGFILTRKVCLKIPFIIKSNPPITFNELINQLEISDFTVSDNAIGRPYLWLDIVASEDLMDLKLSKSTDRAQVSNSNVEPEHKTPKVHAFISHWFSTWENIEVIEKSCSAANYKTTVLNTTDVKRDGWMNELPISFFRQFEAACRNFDQSCDYMFFVTADVVSQEWSDFFDYASKVLALESVGSFSPTLTYDHYNIGRFKSVYFDSGLPLTIIQCNDLIVNYINRKIILEMIKFFDFFKDDKDNFNPTVGFGLEELISRVISSSGLLNFRDRSFALRHPEGSSYNREIALKEREAIMKIAEKFLTRNNSAFTRSEILGQFTFESHRIVDRLLNVN